MGNWVSVDQRERISELNLVWEIIGSVDCLVLLLGVKALHLSE